MNKTTILIQDQVNCKFLNLDPSTRSKIVNALKFLVPNARHLPTVKLGRWDGKISFATAGGGTYINLLDRVLQIVIDAGYDIDIDDRRPVFDFDFEPIKEDHFADKTWPLGHPLAGEPIMLRDYQVSAINNYIQNLQSVQEMSTGSGKTLTTAALSSLVEPYGRSIVIVPSKSLVKQTEEDYINLGLDVGVYFGDRKEYNHKHTIATWQSLNYNAKKSRTGDADIPINEIIEDVVCVMADECHTVSADQLKKLLSGPMANIPIRWGLTGTVPREDFQFLAVLGCIGPVVGGVKAAELQEKGVLANSTIHVIQTNDSHVEFRDYHSEHDWITTDNERMDWISKFIHELEGNTLILVTKLETGRILESMIPDSKFISGATKLKDRTVEYKDFVQEDNKTLIATYGIASTGISITRIHNLVLFEIGKSFTRSIQSIGRGLRKGFDKDHVNVYDICSTLRFSKRHLTQRKGYYKDAEYKFDITKINYKG